MNPVENAGSATDAGQDVLLLQGLLEVGATLYSCRDRQEILDTILSQARLLTGAEAGSLYLVRNGRLTFEAVQNDRMDAAEIARHLLGEEMPVTHDSLSGYVAATGEIMNIPDAAHVPAGAPFRINRDRDARTGYRVRSILAMPLNCSDGSCVGVLQLFNRLGQDGQAAAFPERISSGVLSLASQAASALHNLGLQQKLREVHLNTIFRLSTIAEYRDADTSEHIQRVSQTSEVIARALGFDSEQVDLVKYSSPMHDVGKVAIPDSILLKPGHLTPAQREVMQRHTDVGGEILDGSDDDLLSMAQQVAIYHHERWDGQGYPHGLSGLKIPLCGRVVALADVFDAIVSRRCYKDACPLDVALDIVQSDSGSHFDPEIVEAFLGALDEVLEAYPALKAA